MTQRTLLIAGIALMAAGLLVGSVGGILLDLPRTDAYQAAPGPNNGEDNGPGSQQAPPNQKPAPGFPGGRRRGHRPGGPFPGIIPTPKASASPNA